MSVDRRWGRTVIADAENADEEADSRARTRAPLGQISLPTGIPVPVFATAARGRATNHGGVVPEEAECAELLRHFDRVGSRDHRRILIALTKFYVHSAA